MQRQSGFTLIELMVTVAIIAILAAVAIPNYSDYVRRGKIQEAGTALLAMKTKMEQFFQDNRQYPTACVVPPAVPVATQIAAPQLRFFSITCPTLDATHYTIQAAGGTATDGSMSGLALTINEANLRATTVTAGSPMANAGYGPSATCWTSKKAGEC